MTEPEYLTTEWFAAEGHHGHHCNVPYRAEQLVENLVDQLTGWQRDAQGNRTWLAEEVAYGVIKVEDEVGEDALPRCAPRALRWLRARPECVYEPGRNRWPRTARELLYTLTVGQLFEGVEKREDERFFVVLSKLDLRTVWPVGSEQRADVTAAVQWLQDLYLDPVTKLLRDLKPDFVEEF